MRTIWDKHDFEYRMTELTDLSDSCEQGERWERLPGAQEALESDLRGYIIAGYTETFNAWLDSGAPHRVRDEVIASTRNALIAAAPGSELSEITIHGTRANWPDELLSIHEKLTDEWIAAATDADEARVRNAWVSAVDAFLATP